MDTHHSTVNYPNEIQRQCRICGEEGDKARDCPNNPCSYCNEVGHMSLQCSHRKTFARRFRKFSRPDWGVAGEEPAEEVQADTYDYDYDYVVDMARKHAVVLLQGPSGTGKTTFILILLQIAWHTNTPWVSGASSNAGTDHLASVTNTACPQIGAIRFHAIHSESQAIKKHNEDQIFSEIPETELADVEDSQAAQNFNRFLMALRIPFSPTSSCHISQHPMLGV